MKRETLIEVYKHISYQRILRYVIPTGARYNNSCKSSTYKVSNSSRFKQKAALILR